MCSEHFFHLDRQDFMGFGSAQVKCNPKHTGLCSVLMEETFACSSSYSDRAVLENVRESIVPLAEMQRWLKILEVLLLV